jgi:ankyrin repeat protein
MVRFFIDQGVNVNAVNQTDLAGHTALMGAAAQNNTAAVKLLLEKGADVNLAATDAAGVKNGTLAFKGRTALMMAAAYGSPELIGLLLKGQGQCKRARCCRTDAADVRRGFRKSGSGSGQAA